MISTLAKARGEEVDATQHEEIDTLIYQHRTGLMFRFVCATTLLLIGSTLSLASSFEQSGHSDHSEAVYDEIFYLADSDAKSDAFGIIDSDVLNLHAFAFHANTAHGYSLRAEGPASSYCTATCELYANLGLPSGVQITGLQLDAIDNTESGTIEVRLMGCPVGETICSSFGFIETGQLETPGDAIFTDAGVGHTILNGMYAYFVQVYLNGNADTSFRGVQILYKRQISPAPGTATFADVPTNHIFFQSVEALAASGITGGCGGGNYCPDSPVTRGQMAAFLSRALGLHWVGF